MTMPGVEIHLLSLNPEINNDAIIISQNQHQVSIKSSVIMSDLAIYNTNGQILIKEAVNDLEKNLNLNNGVYFVKIKTMYNTFYRKFIVN